MIDGIGSVIRNVQDGNILGAILTASNTYNNAKKLKKGAIKEELKGIAKEGVLEIGKQAGSITNPVGSFSVGAAVAGAAVIASAKSTNDNNKKNNVNVIQSPSLDTTNFLTPDESYNLITNNALSKSAIAAGIYYKDIGSRKNLTVAESDLEYTNASASVKTVYEAKAVTDIRKLVTEGFIKIERSTLDVSIATEKASL